MMCWNELCRSSCRKVIKSLRRNLSLNKEILCILVETKNLNVPFSNSLDVFSFLNQNFTTWKVIGYNSISNIKKIKPILIMRKGGHSVTQCDIDNHTMQYSLIFFDVNIVSPTYKTITETFIWGFAIMSHSEFFHKLTKSCLQFFILSKICNDGLFYLWSSVLSRVFFWHPFTWFS